MADYKELLRRAISALPENNGAARRAVYEKARSALVGQLRAIQPPLLARDITQHRLQLEDCIRQVEQEASEAVISLGRDGALSQRPTPPVAPRPQPAPQPAPVVAEVFVPPQPEPTPPPPVAPAPVEPEPELQPEPEQVQPPKPTSIEDIISAAASQTGITVAADGETGREVAAAIVALEPKRPSGAFSRPDFFTPRRDTVTPFTPPAAAGPVPAPRIEPILGSTALASQPATKPVLIETEPVDTALSTVREVDLEEDEARAAEGVIASAIETLDREARGEATDPVPERTEERAPPGAETDEAAFAPAEAEVERRSGAGLTIFLIVFAVLLVGVGGAGFWAWREGYVDLDQMFGRTQTAATDTVPQDTTSPLPTMETGSETTGDASTNGPGNTATNTQGEPTTALEEEERLEPTPETVTPTGTETVLPSIDSGEIKTEERLSNEDTSIATAQDDPAASVDPAVLAGNQSLLLEASTDGQSGAVPFSGTVEWTEGVDEIGLPTLVAEASIPARNLDVSITIRRNNDPVLPASHLMEISFDVPDTFIGGSISTLAGVLLKNEELVPGTALSGAAARVVGNSFLFALSASEDDLAQNTRLLADRRWIDLAVVYGNGRNAILTLEKDQDAEALFDRVLAAWAE
jgi:hypothetical protein